MLVQAEGATTSVIDGVTYLFLERTQQICSLTDASASLFAQCSGGALIDGDTIIEEESATVKALLDAGALNIVSHADGEASVAVAETIELAGVYITLCFESQAALDTMIEPFLGLKVSVAKSDAQIVVVEADDKIGISCADDNLVWVDYAQSLPVLKMAITEAVMMAAEGLLIHAATTLTGSKAILLLGGPGAGKSTLALALARVGHKVAGDDLLVLDESGRGRALRLPATLKPGSWSLLSETYPEIKEAHTFHRLDGQDARYIQVAEEDANGAFDVGWILLLDRQEVEEARLSDLTVDEVFAAVLGASWSGAEELEAHEFHAIATCIKGARIARLTYSNLECAVNLLDNMCAEKDHVPSDHIQHQT